MYQNCDRLTRRSMLQVGALGGLGLGLADLLRLDAAAGSSGKSTPKSAILIYLDGGQSHLDSWDMKPEGGEVAGEFKPIQTNVSGLDVCEHMPRLARQADKYAVVRGVHKAIAVHGRGMTLVRTGNRPRASLKYPDVGSVICKERSAPQGIAPFIALPIRMTNSAVASPGYLGAAYGPFTVQGDPNAENFNVRALSTPKGMTISRVESRVSLMRDLDTAYQEVDLANDKVEGMDRFYQQAYDILRSPEIRKAFDLGREADSVRDKYGRHSLGQACLLARRLVEVGVRCITLDFGSWDTHQNNFKDMKDKLLPPFDDALAALLEDLQQRGMLDRTLVWTTGEMGRTPKINEKAGRDHWGKAMSMVLAGCGIQGGQVIGKTDAQGAEVVEDAHQPEDVAASAFHALGIDHHKEYYTPTGRPIQIVRDGNPIQKLF